MTRSGFWRNRITERLQTSAATSSTLPCQGNCGPRPPLIAPRKEAVVPDLAALLEKASSAKPVKHSQVSGKRWVLLLPVFATLLKQGFNGASAIDWLIEQGEVKEDERKRAFFALHQARNRQRKLERSLNPK